jgi:hypothetical protein
MGYNYAMTMHKIFSLSDTAAQRLTPIGTHSGFDITLQNVSLYGDIYIGGEGLTTESYGYKLMPNHSISFELPGKNALYAIAAEESATLAVIRTNLEYGA